MLHSTAATTLILVIATGLLVWVVRQVRHHFHHRRRVACLTMARTAPWLLAGVLTFALTHPNAALLVGAALLIVQPPLLCRPR